MTLRIAIYTRLSHDPTGNQTATARQEKACRAFADVRGWDVVEVFEDVDLSAYRRGVVRPAYERMLVAIQQGSVDGVLVWKLDRLVRRPAEFERFWALCEESGSFVASAMEPIDASTDLGVALVRILVTFAQLESATISVRIKAKQRELAEAGRPFARPPFGWRDGMKDLEPTEAALLREAVDRVLAGESISAIVTDWYRRGVRTRKGKVFAPTTLRNTLRAPFMVGDRTYHGEVVASDCFAPIVNRTEYAVLNAVLATRSVGRTRSKYPLAGILRCGRCGSLLYGGVDRGGYQRYSCTGSLTRCCNRVSVAGAPLDAHVLQLMLTRLRSFPPQAPHPVDPTAVAAVLEAHAAALRSLVEGSDLTAGQRGALQARVIGDLHRETGLVLIEGTRVRTGYQNAQSLSAKWASMGPDEKRAALATVFHYILIAPVDGNRRYFRPDRVLPVYWSTERVPARQLRRIANQWRAIAPDGRPHRSVRRFWTDEELLASLRAWAAATDSPSGEKYRLAQWGDSRLPSLSTLSRRFGGWQKALERVGKPYDRRALRHFTNSEIQQALRRWMRSGGDGRSATYSKAAREQQLPAFETVRLRFGSWHSALASIGVRAPARRWKPDEVRQVIQAWAADNPGRLTSQSYVAAAANDSDMPSLATVTAKLGRWRDLIERIGDQQDAPLRAMSLTRPELERLEQDGSA